MVFEVIIEPKKLPPTEHAAWFHGLRVHLQIIQWKMLHEELNLDPRKWGWELENCILSPTPTDKEVAPPNTLQVIRSNMWWMSWGRSQLSTCKFA